MGDAPVNKALQKIARILDDARIPYAVAGALALSQHGYIRATVDVDLLMTREGLAAFKEIALGRGYVERFAGSKGMRDTEHNVTIDVLIAGDFPGDGKPKPVSFPDPAVAGIQGPGARFLKLGTLIELKLASGMSAPHRLKDLSDVLELIRAGKLPRELAVELDASVRAKYDELWVAAQTRDDQDT